MLTTELYHIRHLCACGANISHSQGDFNAHKFHGGFTDISVSAEQPRCIEPDCPNPVDWERNVSQCAAHFKPLTFGQQTVLDEPEYVEALTGGAGAIR